jgi:hypothetical protein
MSPSPGKPSRLVLLPLILALLVPALLLFFVRGPLRALHGEGGDFATPYVAAVRLLQAHDPYDPLNFNRDLGSRGGPSDALGPSSQRAVYPPTTLLLLAPFALVRWPAALALYVLLCSAGTLVLIWRLARLLGPLNRRSPRSRGVVFAAFALALAPIHTAIGLGNLSAVALLGCGFALLAAESREDVAAGCLLAVALCLKPTTAAAVLLLFLLLRRWRALGACALACLLALAATAVIVRPLDPIWQQHYLDNLRYQVGAEGAASFTGAYADTVNLQTPLFLLLHRPPLQLSAQQVDLLAWAIAAAFALLWLVLCLRKRLLSGAWSWLAVASLCIIGLLPIYQRNYSVGLVLFVLLWAFQALPAGAARIALGLCACLLVPGRSLLTHFVEPHLDPAFAAGPIWHGVILSYVTWTLVLLVCLMLYQIAIQAAAPPSPSTADAG